MVKKLPYCFSVQFSEQLLKFLADFFLLKYVKFQRSYGFLTDFWLQILDLKDHFTASLRETTFNLRYKWFQMSILSPFQMFGCARNHGNKFQNHISFGGIVKFIGHPLAGYMTFGHKIYVLLKISFFVRRSFYSSALFCVMSALFPGTIISW